jgi:UDP-glucuronate 4-epimerase
VDIARAVVTGAGGFIGSHVAERLLDSGVRVLGLDLLTDYYAPAIKEANLEAATSRDNFEFRRVDLASDDLDPHVRGADVVFHQAATPGVRTSWETGFLNSVRNNVTATQRLLEAARRSEVGRFVYASSSSVYGEASEIPMREDGPLRPHSPYGVTKLSGEQLCTVYAENFGIPTVSLRYFTVYGPRQRPDMAAHRLIQAALTGRPFPLYGAAGHVRDFTYVGDIVAANLAAANRPVEPGTVINVAGGAIISMKELIAGIEAVTGLQVMLDDQGRKAGDVTHTQADLTRAADLLDWRPNVRLLDGLKAQVAWHRDHASLLDALPGA